jgi:hypothetical protein
MFSGMRREDVPVESCPASSLRLCGVLRVGAASTGWTGAGAGAGAGGGGGALGAGGRGGGSGGFGAEPKHISLH